MMESIYGWNSPSFIEGLRVEMPSFKISESIKGDETMYEDIIFKTESLQGTILGIIFDKTGKQIKDAISKELEKIENLIKSYSSSKENIEKFFKEKKELYDKIEDFYTERSDKKEAKLKPFRRQIEEINKGANDLVFEYNKDTEKQLAGKAIDFEKGFESIDNDLKKIDDLLEEISEPIKMKKMSSKMSSGRGKSTTVTLLDTPGTYTMCMNSSNETISARGITFDEKEDRALAKINTLKDILNEYLNKIEKINSAILTLKDKSKKLRLIFRNLNDEILYKLDLERLQAFGFDNLE